SPSDIQGLIRAGGNANLFLINPNGIIFGPNAQLDIGGSFVATTANAIAFSGDGEFSQTSAVDSQNPLLSVNPSAFLFNQIAAQPLNSIEVRGNLAVLENRNLLLVGGNVFPDVTSTGGILIDGGTLTAPGGRVELSSIAEPETIGLNVDGNNLSLNFPNDVRRADVTLTNDADVNVRAQGGGSIVVNAQNLSLPQGSELLAGIAPGVGAANSKAGDIEINARQAVILGRGSSIENTVQPKAQGEAGDIKIRAGSLRATEGALLTTSVLGQGTAGNVTINADTVAFDGDAGGSPDFKASGVYSRVESKTPSQGGSIAITTSSLSVTNGAVVTTSTGGTGNGGIVTIVADQVSFDGKGNFNGTFRQSSGAFSAVKEEGVGSGGSINITAGTLSLTNGAVLITSTLGQGNAGNVTINADTVLFDGEGLDFNSEFNSSGVYSSVRPGAVGQGGSVNVTAGWLSLTNGAVVNTSTLGQGDAGNITINQAETVFLDGQGDSSASGLFATTQSSKKAGELTINTRQLIVQNGAQVTAKTFSGGRAGTLEVNATESVTVDGKGSVLDFDTRSQRGDAGDAGNLRIFTQLLVVQNGAKVTARTSGAGDAGTLLVNATESVIVDGKDSNLAFDTSGSGNAQGIRIETGQLVVQNEGQVTVSGTGSGNPGKLDVATDSIFLNNQGRLITTTESGEGGNIRLQVQDLILIRHNSEISASAEGFGNGGNIEIEAPNGFVLAFLSENSDIVASANQGNGGKARATATGVFGFRQFRDRRTPESDFTASSELGIDGTLEINTRDRQLEELPAEFANVEISQVCQTSGRPDQSEFVVTGRGGLPPNPGEALNSDAVQVDLVTLNPKVENRSSPDVSTNPTRPTPVPLVEAQGWVRGANGKVLLTGNAPNAPTVTPHRSWHRPPECGVN
ncbi:MULTISPECIES: beta strand repeat-containing protein, partial [Cyanophyceae]|uniref:beta strand repeat-containing protein n=1 Tax=Cyanophyceae TaxID=3028117 RepID=UPI00168348BD